MEKGITIGVLIVMVVGVLFGVTLLTASAESTGAMTQKQSVTNQSVDVSSAYVGANEVNESINFTIYSQSDWKVQDCPLTSVVLRNGAGTALTADTDYTLYASNGVYSLLNTSKTVPGTSLNTTYVDYSYCADGYNKDSGSRSVANLIIVFAAMALLAFVLDMSGVVDWGLSEWLK